MSRMTRWSRLGAALAATTVAATTFATPALAASTGLARVFTSGATQFVEFTAGKGRANRVEVFRAGDTVTLDDRYRIKAGKGCQAVKGDPTKVRCPVRSGTAVTVSIRLGDRDDVFANKTAMYAEVRGGTGRDRLYGGSGPDLLNGDRGVDRIYGGAGDDFLLGGSGSVSPAPGAGRDVLHGGVGDDTLMGSPGNDYLNAGDGDDLVFPGTGKDYTYAGDGDDTVLDSGGDDTVDAGLGSDRISGGPGADLIYGAEGDDRLYGGTGTDRLYGDDGNDLLNGSVDRAGGSAYDSVPDMLDGGPHSSGDTAETRPGDTTVDCEIITPVR